MVNVTKAQSPNIWQLAHAVPFLILTNCVALEEKSENSVEFNTLVITF